jgi:ankyrin repeat protein
MQKLLISCLAVALFFFSACNSAPATTQAQATPAKPAAVSLNDKVPASYPKDALHKAANQGDEALVAKILKTKPDPDARDSYGGTALHAAMFQGNIKIVQMLINYGLDVNAIGSKNGYTPLHDAVWANNAAAARELLAHGANTGIKGKDGLTPLEKARQEGKTELIKVLETGK